MSRRILSIIILMYQLLPGALSQNCEAIDFQHQADISSTCTEMIMTMLHDQRGLPYLYVANKEGGLTVYNISNITSPNLVATVSNDKFDTLDVMNVFQDGQFLYLALGNHFAPSPGGMAIIEVTDPQSPIVTDFFVVPESISGAGIVKVENNFAYLGTMKSGLSILNVSDVYDISIVSLIIPDINFPVSSPNPNLYNARGMEVKDGLVYLCYDAGGIRIINCIDPENPVETGRYVNENLYNPLNLPRAYNNLVLDDTLIYVTADYCGVEILSVADTANIRRIGWWNPLGCPENNWFTSSIHTNEIQFDADNKLLFLSTGKSDMIVIDVSDPSLPKTCSSLDGFYEDIGSWGISRWENQIYLSYICTLGIPFPSSQTGIKILTYDALTLGTDTKSSLNFEVLPNPIPQKAMIKANDLQGFLKLQLYNSGGNLVWESPEFENQFEFWRNGLVDGIYFMVVFQDRKLTGLKRIVIVD